MSTLDSITDPRSIASISALVAVGVSWTYFQGEITSLKEEQEEIKKHLQAYIRANPTTNEEMDNLRQALKILDSRVNKHQEEMRMVHSNMTVPQSEKVAPSMQTYQRLTKRKDTRTARHFKPAYEFEEESESDFDDDLASEIAAMS